MNGPITTVGRPWALPAVADDTEVARSRSVIRDARPIPKCHPDRPLASKGLCGTCYRAQLPAEPLVGDPAVWPPVVDPSKPGPPGPSAPCRPRGGNWLSPTEELVVGGLLRGQSNKEIAQALGISQQTVKNHMSRIFLKTGAGSRSEVVILWLRRQAGIDTPAALDHLGEVRRGIARVQGDVDRLLGTVREAEAQLRSLPEDAA